MQIKSLSQNIKKIDFIEYSVSKIKTNYELYLIHDVWCFRNIIGATLEIYKVEGGCFFKNSNEKGWGTSSWTWRSFEPILSLMVLISGWKLISGITLVNHGTAISERKWVCTSKILRCLYTDILGTMNGRPESNSAQQSANYTNLVCSYINTGV